MSNLAARIHESLFQWRFTSLARVYAWLLAPSSAVAAIAIAAGAAGPLQIIVLAAEATLLLFDPVAKRLRRRATPAPSEAALPPNGYRTSTRDREDAEEVIAFVKGSWSGEDLSRSQVITRIATASALLAIGIPAGAYALDLLCAVMIFSSMPAIQRPLTRRRLRSAGLYAELAAYEASIATK